MPLRKVRVSAEGTSRPEPEEEFAWFVQRHARGLGRLAYLLLGDDDGAEDLAADVFLVAWRQWERVRSADSPLAYLRQVMVNLASTRMQRLIRERRGLERLHHAAIATSYEPDGAATLDVRSALSRLPPRRRACLVLRYAFDLPEREVADVLGVSVGTVKSQTSKAVDQFRRELGVTAPFDLGAAQVPAVGTAGLRYWLEGR